MKDIPPPTLKMGQTLKLGRTHYMRLATFVVPVLLERLGRTSDEVAQTLRAGGWRGIQEEPARCPVSVYLYANGIHGEVYPAIEPDEDSDGDNHYQPAHVDMDGTTVPLTDAVHEFVVRYDNGDYPDLVLEEAEV